MSPKTPCLFCAIGAGEVPAVMVTRDEDTAAFLDHRPLFKGHVLVVPRRHVATLPDLPPGEVGTFFTAVQRMARAVEVGLGADGTFVAMNNKVSQSVPHLHVHVIPRHKKDGLRGFFWPRARYADQAEELDFARRIREALPAP